MDKKIKIAIAGYGNIGKGAHLAALAAPDMELAGIFTRRDPATIETIDGNKTPVFHLDKAESMVDEIDVLLLCGGSANDLAEHGPRFAKNFNIVDSYDIHSKIPEYLSIIDSVAKKTTAVISSGWDPGLFSMLRLLSEAILPDGVGYTFWGRGLSQGHSNAIRQVDGVKNAVQYTVPIESALESVRCGERPELTPRQKMLRECYVVAEQGADKSAIEHNIKTMPDYFANYDTTVTFVDEDELLKNHSEMPHGGVVMHSGRTGKNEHVIEYSLKLGSNPEFTASVMIAYARAAYKLASEGQFGAKTVFDIPLNYLSEKKRLDIIRKIL